MQQKRQHHQKINQVWRRNCKLISLCVVEKCVLFYTPPWKKEKMNFKLFYFIRWIGAFETWQKVNAKIITNFTIKNLQADIIMNMTNVISKTHTHTYMLPSRLIMMLYILVLQIIHYWITYVQMSLILHTGKEKMTKFSYKIVCSLRLQTHSIK